MSYKDVLIFEKALNIHRVLNDSRHKIHEELNDAYILNRAINKKLILEALQAVCDLKDKLESTNI